MPAVRQTDFSGGELDPKLWGRTDLEKFKKGARRLRNFFVSPHGEAVSRPGTEYVRSTKLSGDSAAVRLIPFVYSDELSYCLEFGHEYVRFHTLGGTVMDGPDPYEVVTPYSSGSVSRLQFCQSGDIITLTHPSYPPMELRRVAHDDWEIATVTLTGHLQFQFNDVNAPYVRTNEPYLVTPLPTADASHPAREWKWIVTALGEVDGTQFETLGLPIWLQNNGTELGAVTQVNTTQIVLYSDKPITIRRVRFLPPTNGGNIYKTLGYNFYRGRGALFGWVGTTKERDFVDVGAEPDYAIQPPLSLNPFQVHDATGALVRTEMPSSSIFFQERRVFTGTAERPGYIFASSVGDYTNFDQRDLAPPGSALVFDLLTRKREDIRSLAELSGRLILLTKSTVRSMAGHQGQPLDATSVDSQVIEEIGANHLQPLVVDGALLYCRAKGRGVRAIVPANTRSGFQGVDISTVSQHLFLGETHEEDPDGNYFNLEASATKEIVAWCYQEDPYGLVWAVRDDGVLLSLQFSQSEQTWAWSRHDTDGEVLDVCSVPEGDEDSVYLVVQRTGGMYVERMKSRVQKGGPDDDAALDSALRYEGEATDTFTGLQHLEGKQVYVVSPGNDPLGPFTVTSGAITLAEELATPFAEFTLDPEAYTPVLVAHVGLLFTPELETLDIRQAPVGTKQKTVTHVSFEVDGSRGLWAGQDFEHMAEWRQRRVSDGYRPPSASTELVRVAVPGKWEMPARAALQQRLPLPVTILGITREVSIGDD